MKVVQSVTSSGRGNGGRREYFGAQVLKFDRLLMVEENTAGDWSEIIYLGMVIVWRKLKTFPISATFLCKRTLFSGWKEPVLKPRKQAVSN